MGRLVRILEGRFGRLVLSDLAAGETCAAQADPAILMQSAGADLVFLNPGESYTAEVPTRILALHAAGDWLRASFPAVFGGADARLSCRRARRSRRASAASPTRSRSKC